MADSLIAGDAAFAVVLAAWWQLRRSAHLLPHLRKGPSSFFFNPGHGFVSRIMAIITVHLLLTRRRRRRPTPVASPKLNSGPEELVPEEWGREQWSCVTAPIPIPAGLRPAPQRVARSVPRLSSRPAPEPSTCPLPMDGLQASGPATLPIGPQLGPHRENGPGYVKPPTQPAADRWGAA
jgi:hypothetical protein